MKPRSSDGYRGYGYYRYGRYTNRYYGRGTRGSESGDGSGKREHSPILVSGRGVAPLRKAQTISAKKKMLPKSIDDLGRNFTRPIDDRSKPELREGASPLISFRFHRSCVSMSTATISTDSKYRQADSTATHPWRYFWLLLFLAVGPHDAAILHQSLVARALSFLSRSACSRSAG